MRIKIFTICLLATTLLNAQQFEWVKTLRGNSSDFGQAITTDDSGNVYIAGYHNDTLNIDTNSGVLTIPSGGSADFFIAKIDSTGNYLWIKSTGGASSQIVNTIAVDNAGNVYTTGQFQGTVDFDPGAGTTNLTSAGSWDIFIQKLDASGNFLWAESFGSSSVDLGLSVTADNANNVIVTGNFRNTVDFDPGLDSVNLTAVGDRDVFILKLDSTGNFQWAKAFGGANADYGRDVVTDPLDNVYTTGYYRNTVDFDPSSGVDNRRSNGSLDIFVHKIDSAGNYLWVKTFGGNSAEEGYSIKIDSRANVYTAGYFLSNVDFDPGTGTMNLVPLGSRDVFVQKMDSAGNFLWAKALGGTLSDFGFDMSIDDLDNVYTTGRFEGTVDFNPDTATFNLTAVGAFDTFVQKMDSSGNFIWVQSFGGGSFDEGRSISTDGQGNVYTIGYFEDTVDFNPASGISERISAGGADIFIQKMSPCTSNSKIDTVIACGSYTWIDGITYTSSNNNATYTLTNSVGCDSIITLNLTINSFTDTTTTLNGLSITANNPNATYQWLNCDSSYSIISGEINQTFTATADGNYAVEITENSCIDTSACVAIITVGLIKNSFGDKLNLYPNPSHGNFSIDLGKVYPSTEITITDMKGKLVQTKVYNQTQLINLSLQQAAGIYLVRIHSAEEQAVFRLMKE